MQKTIKVLWTVFVTFPEVCNAAVPAPYVTVVRSVPLPTVVITLVVAVFAIEVAFVLIIPSVAVNEMSFTP